jgi:hypothetical protein
MAKTAKIAISFFIKNFLLTFVAGKQPTVTFLLVGGEISDNALWRKLRLDKELAARGGRRGIFCAAV